MATRGVNQAGDHAVGGSDKLATARGLRPECSRRPVWVERTDVSVAQPVVDQREQFAGRGDLGDVFAAASCETVFVAQRTNLEPCLVICPRCTTVSDSRWRGVSPAHEHR